MKPTKLCRQYGVPWTYPSFFTSARNSGYEHFNRLPSTLYDSVIQKRQYPYRHGEIPENRLLLGHLSLVGHMQVFGRGPFTQTHYHTANKHGRINGLLSTQIEMNLSYFPDTNHILNVFLLTLSSQPSIISSSCTRFFFLSF